MVADGGTDVAWPAEGSGTFAGYWFCQCQVDGSESQSIDIAAGAYTGTELATLMTLNLNAKFSDEKSYKMPVSTADRTITLELQDSNGNDINKAMGPEIDTLTYTPIVCLEVLQAFNGSLGYWYLHSGLWYQSSRHSGCVSVQINWLSQTFAVKRVDDHLVVTAPTTALPSCPSPLAPLTVNYHWY